METETQPQTKKSFFDNPLLKTRVKSANVKMPEMLIGYLLGPFGALLASGIFTAFLNYFFTDVIFLRDLFLVNDAGQWINELGEIVERADRIALTTDVANMINGFLFWLPLLSAILIVIGNLVVGQLIEKTKTKAGKARPWILLSSVLLGGACILLFTVPLMAGTNNIARMILITVSYNLYYSVAYPMYNTANSALVPLSTRNASQRSGLASFVNFSHLGVMGVGSMVFPVLVSAFLTTSAPAWALTFTIIGILSFVVTVLQYYFTRERVTEESLNVKETTKKDTLPLGKQISACVKEPFWWIILCFYLLFQFSGAIKNLSMTYFCKSVVDNSFWAEIGIIVDDPSGMTQTMLGIAGAVPMAVAMAFIWPLSRKFSKQAVVIVGALIGAVGGVIAGIWAENVIAVTIGVALKCFGSAPACYMILAMIADMLDHMEAKTGKRYDGFTMSVYSSLMVASTPVMTAVFNAISRSGANTTAVTVSYIWIETIAYVAAALLLCLFTVEKGLKKDQETIKARQKAEAEAAGLVWEDPADRLKREEAEAEAASEAARIEESKAYCAKKGLNFEEVEAEYQRKLAEKRARDEARKNKKK